MDRRPQPSLWSTDRQRLEAVPDVPIWLRRHPWFEAEVLPELRRRVAGLMAP